METLQIKRLDSNRDLPLPKYQTEGSAGIDLLSNIDETLIGCSVDFEDPDKVVIDRKLIPTGLSIAIPEGYCGMICSRSGLAVKYGIKTNIPVGIIDSDYRGEISISLANTGYDTFYIKRGDRIAQLLIVPVIQPEISEVKELSTTERGEGGFGSTGV